MKDFKYNTDPFGNRYPNAIYQTNDDFYISYNDRDTRIYGDVTTAIVVGECDKFYILKGDHRDRLAELSQQGLDACLEYYRANPELQHKFSDKLD